MESLIHFLTLSRYNRWMNERIYDACADLTDSERKADRGAFFHSIHGTLNHLLLADRLWLGRFTGQPFRVARLNEELYSDFGDLRRERRLTDEAIDAWISALSEPQLAAPLSFTCVVDAAPRSFPLWHAVLHFFNHQTHHRGQVTTLLMQAGRDPGVTDLLRLPGAALDRP